MLQAVWASGLVVCQTPRIADAAQELTDHGATCVVLDVADRVALLSAIEELGAASPDTPIIALSDGGDDGIGVAALRAGAQDCLIKPELDVASLSRAVRYAVERKRSEVVLAHQALHDQLTALPNRALFVDRLRVALDRSRRTDGPVAVMFLDVDAFKQVNDSLGHAAGDELLRVLADRFRGLLRPMDTVARFGGDEFTFLFEGLADEREAMQVAERVSRSAAVEMPLGGSSLSVSVSIGVALVTDPMVSIEGVIADADSAMYRAKEHGGARAELFDGGAARRHGRRPDLESDLRRALERSQLRVHYQPKVSLSGPTGLIGFEALVRWEHPERGMIRPADFIPLAEEAGLIVPIGDWVVDEALGQIRRWRRARPGVTISVNLSGRQLEDPGLVARVDGALRHHGGEPGVLCLEVAHAVLADRPELSVTRLGELRELGVQLAIDDFGTSGVRPTGLERLPVDMLKIDRSLVSGLSRTGPEASAVGSAVELGHTLGLDVIAEGVETDLQLARVRELGCDGAQGFLFSQPIPEDGVYHLLASGEDEGRPPLTPEA